MGLSDYLRTAYGQLLLLSVGVFAVLAILIIPSYFIVIRPRRGTTEWMGRIDRPHFSALQVQKLRWSDIAWVLLSGFCSMMLRLIGYLLMYLRRGWLDALTKYFDLILLNHLLPCTILAVLTYVLLRSIFDQPLPAICGAILGGMMQMDHYFAAILIVLSLIFLWRFLAAGADTALSLHSLWLFFSLLFYGASLLFYWSLICLAPAYIAAYVFSQVYRWRKSTQPNRGIALAISLLLLFFMAVGAILCAWAYYCYHYGQLDQIMNLQYFWEVMSDKFILRCNALLSLYNPLIYMYAEDAILLVMGAVCALPILHGVLAKRDSFCLALICLAPWFVVVWMCSGMYLLVLPLILALTWVTNVLWTREYPSLTIGFTVLTVIGFLAEYYI